MYEGQGQSGLARNPSVAPPQPREQISSINAETIGVLESVVRSLDHLTAKTLGPRPEEAGNKALDPTPSLMNDARKLNVLAHQISARCEELHASIGHEKQ